MITNEEIKTLNIYQRMSAITNELERVAKNLNVGVGKSSYKAVGEADILNAVKPIEVTNGVYSYPVSRNIVDSGTIENEAIDFNTKEKIKKSQLFMRVETVYRFVNVDSPTEFIDVTTYGDGVDGQDKAPGKAMTYADKYALMKAYKIVTGDDPDQHASQDLTSTSTQTKLTDKQIQRLFVLGKSAGYSKDQVFKHLDDKFKKLPDALTKIEYDQVCLGYEKVAKANTEKIS